MNKKIGMIVRGSLIAIGTVLFFVITVAAIKQQNKLYCTDTLVHIDYRSGNYFLNEDEVVELMTGNGSNVLIGKALRDIDFANVEAQLNKNPYIDNAEVYSNMQGDVIADVRQKQPILRIINKDGVSYYLSDNGQKIPLSDKFTPRITVATGFINISGESDSTQATELLELTKFVQASPFWNAMIEQIYVNENKEIELVPKIGDHIVLFGKVDEDMEVKFNKLKIFYSEGLNYVGWSKYKTIDIKYANQIVCTKK